MKKKCFYKMKWMIAGTLAVLFFCCPAFAAETPDPSFTTALDVRFVMDGTPVHDLSFYVHKVADWSGSREFYMDARYEKYGVIDPCEMKDNEQWLSAAASLADKIRADQNAPAARGSGKTGSDGSVCFEGLTPGVYLIYSDWTKIGDYKYAAVPYFVILPVFNEEKNEWSRSSVSYPKRQKLPDYTKLNALKVWNDKGYESRRPSEVTVHLLKNGTVVDTRKLNASNGWKCTFENLSKEASYSVTEDTVSGYTTSITAEGITYVITNKRKSSYTPSPSPSSDSGGKGPSTEVFAPLLVGEDQPESNPVVMEETGYAPNQVLGAAASRLPQTGLLWWPVIALFLVGSALILIGTIIEKKK